MASHARQKPLLLGHLGRVILALFSLALITPASSRAEASSEQIRHFSGVARTKNGSVVYREQHRETYRAGRLHKALSLYYDAKGRLIGRLASDYSRRNFAPNYRFTDIRRGVMRAARLDGNNLVLSDGKRVKALRHRGGAPLVVGQGLNRYVHAHLPQLSKGKVGKVRFAIPSRFSTYGFRVRSVARPRPGVLRLRIEVDSWLLRLIAPTIEVDYQLSTRRLLAYRGPSNLADKDGDTMQVRIRYDYRGRR